MIEKMLRCHGQRISIIRNGKTTEVYGFLQPVTGKGQNMSRITVSAAGAGCEGQYIYIGPVEPEAMAGDRLEAGGRQFCLRRAERVSASGEAAYTWGMCVEKGGADHWGMNG